MKPLLFPAAAAVAGLLTLAGCASAPVQYYTLSAPVADTTSAAPAPSVQDTLAIDVLPVGLPEMLDRQPIVVRQGDAGVAVVDGQRWASPLSEELRTALAAQLAAQPGVQNVAGLARPAGAPVWRIKLEVRRLDAWPGQQLQMDAGWSASRSGEPAMRLTCQSRIAQPLPADYPGLAAAHQAAVAQLARQMREALQRQAC